MQKLIPSAAGKHNVGLFKQIKHRTAIQPNLYILIPCNYYTHNTHYNSYVLL